MPDKLTLEEVTAFVEENSSCRLLSNEYTGIYQTLLFECHCGKKYESTYYKFKNKKYKMCKECARREERPNICIGIDEVREFISKNTECVLLSDTYTGVRQKIDIKCKCGNIFSTKFNNFKRSISKMCIKCSKEKTGELKSHDIELVRNFIVDNSESILVSNEYKNSGTRLLLMCKCGREYRCSFGNFKSGYGRACRLCLNNMSNGETAIKNYLNSICVAYSTEYTFPDLRGEGGKLLRFDFAVFKEDKISIMFLIEFDGAQHFRIARFSYEQDGESALKRIQVHDKLKDNYCENNNIYLLRIPYTKIKDIPEIIEEAINKLKHGNTEPSQY